MEDVGSDTVKWMMSVASQVNGGCQLLVTGDVGSETGKLRMSVASQVIGGSRF